MKTRHESRLAAKIDKADRKHEAEKERVTKKQKRSGRSSQGLRPIGEDFSSQYEEAENEMERVGRGPE
jgi:hypothetical protein